VKNIDDYLVVLRRGGVVACPTETLYGLLADALNPEAVARVAAIKRRKEGDPIAVLVSSVEMAKTLVTEFPDEALKLAERYWPGPLTLIMRARDGLPNELIQNGSIGIRIPGPSPAFDLVNAFGRPLTATSANFTAEPAASTAEEVERTLGSLLDAIVPGHAPGGAPSTVVDVTQEIIRVVRKGAIAI
jgi:L-threonylcarbamoyladenylate synthase